MNTQHRTQLYLDSFRYNNLKHKSKIERKSLAQVVREAIDLMLVRQEEIGKKEKEKDWEKFLKLAGIGSSGLRDLSYHHDRYYTYGEIKSWKRKKK